MGGAASAVDDRSLIAAEVQAQRAKPADASDVADMETAVLEITKLRHFFRMLDLDSISRALDVIDHEGRGESKASAEPAGAAELERRGLAIVSVLKTKMAQRFGSLHESFLSIDTDKSGYLSEKEFQEVRLRASHFFLSHSNCVHVRRAGIGELF